MDNKAENSFYKSIFGAFLILIMHILLAGGVGILILFFRGIIDHMAWVLLGVSCSIIGSGYWFFKRMKSDSRVLKDKVEASLLKGKTVEVSFLGGVATFKISDSQDSQIKKDPLSRIKQLEAPDHGKVKTLSELARLYEKKLITFDEYNKAKQEFFK